MNHTETITDFDDPRVAAYRKIRRSNISRHLGKGYFVAETAKVIEQLLQTDLEIDSLFLTQFWFDQFQSLILERTVSPKSIFIASHGVMESTVGYAIHQGVMATVRAPESVELDELDSRVVVFDGVLDPENVGSTLRSCVAFGLKSIIVDKNSADPYLRRSVRVSMGNVFQSKVHRTHSLAWTLEKLRYQGYQVIGSDMRPGAASLEKYSFPKKFALVIGSEVHGMSEEVMQACDQMLRIPTSGPNLALNASHAATVLFYAASVSLDSDGEMSR